MPATPSRSTETYTFTLVLCPVTIGRNGHTRAVAEGGRRALPRPGRCPRGARTARGRNSPHVSLVSRKRPRRNQRTYIRPAEVIRIATSEAGRIAVRGRTGLPRRYGIHRG